MAIENRADTSEGSANTPAAEADAARRADRRRLIRAAMAAPMIVTVAAGPAMAQGSGYLGSYTDDDLEKMQQAEEGLQGGDDSSPLFGF